MCGHGATLTDMRHTESVPGKQCKVEATFGRLRCQPEGFGHLLDYYPTPGVFLSNHVPVLSLSDFFIRVSSYDQP